MVSAFENNPEIGFVFCRVLEIKEENGASLFRPWTREHVLKNDIKNPVVSRSQIVNTNSFMFRREVFDRVGNFNEVYSNGEDGDMWMRISEQFKGKFADHFGATYRINHGSNQLTSNAKEKIKQCGLLIFENCQKRYFDLKLRDPKRIFKIKLNFLWAKPPSTFRSKLTYHFKYLVLSLRYPSGYLQKKIEDYYDKKEAPKSGAWYKLDEYIN